MHTGKHNADRLGVQSRQRRITHSSEAADDVARTEAERLEATYDTERLKALIAADGWAKA